LGTQKPQTRIKAPKLPKVLPPAELPGDMPTYGETYSQLDYQQLDLADQTIERLHFETIIFSQVVATGSRFEHLRLEDIRFTGSSLANAVWPKASCVRAEFIGCRMTGFSTEESLFTDTLFRDCKVDLAQFYQVKMPGVRFEDCPLTGTDFRKSDLTGAVFLRCDLSNADFTGATLSGADLRGCQIDGMRAGPDELRGAILDQVQALALVRAMGIIVE
jgi:uncharacterized protein YjbI with pentapeptide repeats